VRLPRTDRPAQLLVVQRDLLSNCNRARSIPATRQHGIRRNHAPAHFWRYLHPCGSQGSEPTLRTRCARGGQPPKVRTLAPGRSRHSSQRSHRPNWRSVFNAAMTDVVYLARHDEMTPECSSTRSAASSLREQPRLRQLRRSPVLPTHAHVAEVTKPYLHEGMLATVPDAALATQHRLGDPPLAHHRAARAPTSLACIACSSVAPSCNKLFRPLSHRKMKPSLVCTRSQPCQ
jgi:hypothetical protein